MESRNSDYFQAHVAFPEVNESEFECLNLLIVRPSAAGPPNVGLAELSKLPVIAYIHGGAGSGTGSDPIYGA
jgi:carboxylesterase type B